jgi:hypothetical protein
VLNQAPCHEDVSWEWMHTSTNSWSRHQMEVSFTPRPLYPQGKSPWYPLDRRLGGSESRSGRGVKRKIPSPRRESKSSKRQDAVLRVSLKQRLRYDSNTNANSNLHFCGEEFSVPRNNGDKSSGRTQIVSEKTWRTLRRSDITKRKNRLLYQVYAKLVAKSGFRKKGI